MNERSVRNLRPRAAWFSGARAPELPAQPPRVRWRTPFLTALAALLLIAAPAAGDPGSEKTRIDGTIGDLQARIDRADDQAGVLTSDLSEVTAEIRSIHEDVAAQQARLAELEGELAASRTRLQVLDARVQQQTEQLQLLGRQYDASVRRLEQRLRDIYTSDTPDTLSFAFGASSFADLLDSVELMHRIGRQDRRIAAAVEQAAHRLARVRTQTRHDRAGVARETGAIEQRTETQRAVRDRLVATRDNLVEAERAKERTLASIRQERDGFASEVGALQVQSAALAEKIAAAQAAAAARAAAETASASTAAPAVRAAVTSSEGLAWPVAGAITSGFGQRWGRMHEGIDIAVPSGTPVGAAAAGTVIYAGWLGGYGNLVVVDHGNGLATAYAHNTSVSVGVGEQVVQGQTLALSGSTGHSSGPHVHFEVRVNGTAVDPLGYL